MISGMPHNILLLYTIKKELVARKYIVNMLIRRKIYHSGDKIQEQTYCFCTTLSKCICIHMLSTYTYSNIILLLTLMYLHQAVGIINRYF